MKMSNFAKLLVAIVVSQAAGLLGTIFTTPKIPTWYAELAKPSFNPPSWIFGPVWTTLFLLMGIAAYMVWKNGLENRGTKTALGIFLAQLVANVLWSAFFFGLENPGLGFAWILLLWAMIAWTISEFRKLSKPAAYLLVPYILWVSFASALNFAIWQLNS
jgi:tryptophan-rich sensory protein